MEHDEEEQRQQADAGQVEGHRDGLVRAAREQVGREVEAREGHGEHDERLQHALHVEMEPARVEVIEAAAHQEKRAEVQDDLRVRQHPALDDPIIVSPVEARGTPSGSGPPRAGESA